MFVFLILLLLNPASAFAVDCTDRLTPDFATFVEKVLDANAVTLDMVEKLAKSDRPFNPIRHLTGRLEYSHYVEIFDRSTEMPADVWAGEQVKLLNIVAARRKDATIQAAANEVTAWVINPEIAVTLPLTYKRLPFLNANDGEIYYLVLENKRLMVKRLFSNTPVWKDDQDWQGDSVSDATLRLSPSGTPELMYLRYNRFWDRMKKRFWNTNKNCFDEITVNLRTGTQQSQRVWLTLRDEYEFLNDWSTKHQEDVWIYHEYGATKAAPLAASEIVIWEGPNYEKTRWKIEPKANVLWETKILQTADQKVYAAILKFDGKTPGRVLEVYERSQPDAPILSYAVPNEKSQLLVFEENGELYVLVDQLNGSTFFFRPLRGNDPFAEIDMNSYRRNYLELLRGKNGQVFLEGINESQSLILRPFSRSRAPDSVNGD